MTAVNQVESKVSHFLRGPFLLMKDCMGQQIACTRASVNERRLKIMKMIQRLERDLLHIISGYSFPNDNWFDVGRAFPTHNVLLMRWIEAEPGGGFSAMPPADEIKPESL